MKENDVNILEDAFWIFVRIIVLMCFTLAITLHNSGEVSRAIMAFLFNDHSIQWLYENPTMNIRDSTVSSYVLTVLNQLTHS